MRRFLSSVPRGNVMAQRKFAVDVPEGYSGAVYRAPVASDLARSIMHLLAHKGQPWLPDIEARLAREDLDLSAVAFADGEPVAHAWLGSSESCPEAGLIGHVYTVEEHRRRGLARSLVGALLSHFDAWGGRWVQLSTANEAAMRVYRRCGFRTVQEGLRDDSLTEQVMLRGGEEEGGVGEAYHRTSGEWEVEPYGLRHYAAVWVFLSAVGGSGKLPAVNIDKGVFAQERLLDAYEAQERGECRLSVLIDAANGRPHGVACRKEGSVEVYAPRVDQRVHRVLAECAASVG